MDGLSLGIDYAREALVSHDINLGRDRPSTKFGAELIEKHIQQMEEARRIVRDNYPDAL